MPPDIVGICKLLQNAEGHVSAWGNVRQNHLYAGLGPGEWFTLGLMGRLSPDEVAASMRKIPLFSALDESELQRLLRLCPVKTLPAGSRIFSPLQRAENFYVILAGEVKLCKLSARGDEQILHLYGPGRAFGEAAMLAGIDYPAFAETLTDATLLTVGRKAIKELIDTHSDIAMAMLAGMSAKLREFNLLIEQLSLKEVPARLAGVLLKLAGQTDGNVIRLPQTKRQLASQIGTTAETLSRAFAKIKTMKLIEVDSRQITILDIEGLTDLATD